MSAATVFHLFLFSISTEWYGLVWYSMVRVFFYISTVWSVPNTHTIPPILVTLLPGYQAFPKGPKRVKLHTLQSINCKQAKSCL